MDKYLIKKGENFSRPFIKGSLLFKDSLLFEFKFDSNCIYKFDDIDKYDINKLIGFSDDWYHHKNSIRIGWNCFDGKFITLYWYKRINGKVESGEIFTVTPGEKITGGIQIYDDKILGLSYYRIYVNNESGNTFKHTTERVSKWKYPRYILYPYFGGNKTAPHDMTINLEYDVN